MIGTLNGNLRRISVWTSKKGTPKQLYRGESMRGENLSIHKSKNDRLHSSTRIHGARCLDSALSEAICIEG